jgi:hypothetical protein
MMKAKRRQIQTMHAANAQEDSLAPAGAIAAGPWRLAWPALCVAILLWTAAYPFSRAFRLLQITYNEGWNVYNAQRAALHLPLYTSTYGWTAVNYPALSFHLVAWLSQFTSEYLFTARILSLAGLCLCGVFAGLIVNLTTRSKWAAWFSGLFLVAVFCADANTFVGMDDPQMLAQAFFLAGFYAYLRGGRKGCALEATALLFVVGGNIKHNLIEFPLAVLLDLLLTAPRRAARFAAGGALMAAISVGLTSRIDGTAYVSCLLTPRGYSLAHAATNLSATLLPLLLPTAAAFWMARLCWKTPARRVLALLLCCALAVDAFFSGGRGVTINGIFGMMLAIVLLNGVFWTEFSSLATGRLKVLTQASVCAIFFLWLAIPMATAHNLRTDKALARSRAGEQNFALEAAYVRQQPGPALCESLLLCYYAGKPYVYDPFNATRFIYLGRLDASVIVNRLRNQEYGAVQLSASVEQLIARHRADSHFAPSILRAIQQDYRVGFTNENGVVYLPRKLEAIRREQGASAP